MNVVLNEAELVCLRVSCLDVFYKLCILPVYPGNWQPSPQPPMEYTKWLVRYRVGY